MSFIVMYLHAHCTVSVWGQLVITSAVMVKLLWFHLYLLLTSTNFVWGFIKCSLNFNTRDTK